MSETDAEKGSLKEQRDRFLAFSFASADLFVEVSGEGRVIFAAGAAKGVTGLDEKSLIGKKWLELLSVYEQARMINVSERAKPGKRCGPMLVNMSETMGARKAILTVIRMPGSDKLYLAFGLSSAIMARIAHAIGDHVGLDLLGRGDFEEAACGALNRARLSGQEVSLTFFDFAPTAQDRKRVGESGWKKMRESIAEFLIAECVDGYAACEMMDGRYAFLHDKKITTESLKEKFVNLTKQTDPSGLGVAVKVKTLLADLKVLKEKQTPQAVKYALDEFHAKGGGMSLASLNGGFDSFVASNVDKLKEFQGWIERSSFNLHFQPVVDLQTNQAKYFEILCRFEQGSTMTWIKFAEDMGLASAFDDAMCDRAINHIKFKAGGTWTRFSINVSWLSVENPLFVEKLLEKLGKEQTLTERLMFEVTNSSRISDMDAAAKFISGLQKLGYKVALDDFTDGQQASEILHRLKPDVVKIDGKYMRNLQSSGREAAVVKNLAETCEKMNIEFVAKWIEDRGQSVVLQEIGVRAAQGYYFGKPGPKPDFVPNKN